MAGKKNKNKVKLIKIFTAFFVMAVTAVLATMGWFYFTLRPDMKTGTVKALEYGTLKISKTEYGEDIGINGEIELDVDNDEEMYPGSSGSLTFYITSDALDITSFILTYTNAAPTTDDSVFEKARDISERHILLFKDRQIVGDPEPILDSNGNPVYDSEGNQKYKYTYTYSDPFRPVGEWTDDDPVPEYRIFHSLEPSKPYQVTLYWVWPYDYDAYGEVGDYDYLFPPDRVKTADEEGLTDAEIYDDEDSYLGKVVTDMRFKFFVNGKRSIVGL